MAEPRYLIALGSNMRHRSHGGPRKVIEAALAAMSEAGLKVERVSRVIDTAPVGPSRRTYANAAAVVKSKLDPAELLATLQGIETHFGRRRGGQRWRARVLDLDVVLWSGGVFSGPGLIVPHPAFRERLFVLGPASEIASDWRDPITGMTVRQLRARLLRRFRRS